MPTPKLRDDGICFDTRVSGRMLWLELGSGAVWGIFFRSNGAFLSYRDLQRICQRLDEARFEQTGRVLSHLAMMFGWTSAGSADSFEQLSGEIAENIVKETIHADKGWNHQYLLTDASVRNLSQPYLEQFWQGLAAFGAGLDQEILSLTRVSFSKPFINHTAYNYLKHPLEKVCRNRRQALLAYPLLHSTFTETDPDHRARRLQHGVDVGNPLPTAVADYFRRSKTVARFLAEKDLDLIGEVWSCQCDKLAHLLSLLKPDYWPRDANEWQLLNQWLLPVYNALDEQRNRERLHCLKVA